MRFLVMVPPVRVSWIGVPVLINAFSMFVALAVGQALRIAAIAPATCGVAIDVPLKNAKVEALCGTATIEDWMLDPGAITLVVLDMLEKEEMTSDLSDDATESAEEMHPGEPIAEVKPLLPAAMAVNTPALRNASSAGFCDSLSQAPAKLPPPRLMLTEATVPPPMLMCEAT